MYVKNSEEVDVKKFTCSKLFGQYLILKGLPLFGIEDGMHVFVKTEKFEEIWKTIPFYVKILYEMIP